MKEKQKELYKKIVQTLSEFSTAERLKVGAIILKNGRIISTGYNGHLPGREHKQIIVNNHDVSTIHAEQNCLLHCSKEGISVKDCEMVVSHFPCLICTKMCIMAGIKKIYYVNDYKNDENVFAKEINLEKI